MEKNFSLFEAVTSGETKDLWAFLNGLYQSCPDHVLFSYSDGGAQVNITVSRWLDDIRRCASWMKAEGVCGIHIGVSCDNCYEWFVLTYAAVLTGNVAVLLNNNLMINDLLQQLKAADVKLLLCDFEQEQKDALDDLSGGICQILSIEKTVAQACTEYDPCPTHLFETVGEDAEAMMLFSSGTSGIPKGVVLTVKNLLSGLVQLTEEFCRGSFLLSVPLHHISGVYMSLIFMQFPVTMYICRNSRSFIRDINKYLPDILCMVPSQIEFLMFKLKKNQALQQAIKQNVKIMISLGAAFPEECEHLFGDMDIHMFDAYGMTEVAGAINRWWEPRVKGSVGRPLEHFDFKIEDRELVLWGPCVMKGYYHNAQANEQALKNRWFYTGDLVSQDSDGNLRLIGRKKNTIILSNGENVSPEVLEKKINSRQNMGELIVTGRNGIIEAVFYLDQNDNDSNRAFLEAVVDEVNAEIPMFQKIRRVTFQDQPFERTPTGKIKRF